MLECGWNARPVHIVEWISYGHQGGRKEAAKHHYAYRRLIWDSSGHQGCRVKLLCKSNLDRVSYCSVTNCKTLENGVKDDIRGYFGMGYLHSCSEAELN